MNVDVKLYFFAKSREIVGKPTAKLNVPSEISYESLLDRVVEEFGLKDLRNNILLSLNEVLCNSTDVLVLQAGDEIGVIPPLSGG